MWHHKFDLGLKPLTFYVISHQSCPGKRIDVFPRQPAKLLFVGSRLVRADICFDFASVQLALTIAMLISVAVLAVECSGVLFPPKVPIFIRHQTIDHKILACFAR